MEKVLDKVVQLWYDVEQIRVKVARMISALCFTVNTSIAWTRRTE